MLNRPARVRPASRTTRLVAFFLAACCSLSAPLPSFAAEEDAAASPDAPAESADSRPAAAPPTPARADGVFTLWEAQDHPDLEVKFIAKDATAGWLYVKNRAADDLRIELPTSFVAKPDPPTGKKRSAFIETTQVLGGGFPPLADREARRRTPGETRPEATDAAAADSGPVHTVRGKRALHLSVRCVCLEYGKPEPSSLLPYKIRPADSFTTQAELIEVLQRYGRGEAAYGPAQAAAWHLSNHLSWEELAAKRRGDEPLLSRDDLRLGRALVEAAEKTVRDRPRPQ